MTTSCAQCPHLTEERCSPTGCVRRSALDDLPLVDTSPRAEARRWRQKVEDAERTACTLFRAAWPVGSGVSWRKSGPVLHGLVREHNPYGPSLWVTNAATGRTYKISHYDVLRAPVAP